MGVGVVGGGGGRGSEAMILGGEGDVGRWEG